MANKGLQCLKKGEYVKFKNYERKIKSPFIDSESILVPEDNGKQNPEESYTNKYKKHIACSYGYKLVYVDDKFSKPFKTYFAQDVVYNFINSMIKEYKYCSDLMKKHFNRELVITKEDNEDFGNYPICWISDNDYVDNHCHITEKYSGSAHRDCNIILQYHRDCDILN